MSEPEMVNAYPTKSFFIENFTRDLSLEDVILDLIDNSIDSFIRNNGIDVSSNLLFSNSNNDHIHAAKVEIVINDKQFEISDNSGGIDIDHAVNDVFRFGRTNTAVKSALGVYGIGLKRAIFKIGKKICVTSKTLTDGFKVDIEVDEWLMNDDVWKFPLHRTTPASSKEESGTWIRVDKLNEEVSLRIQDPTFLTTLKNYISSTYSLFIDKYVNIILNNVKIEPDFIPVSASEKIIPASYQKEINGVHIDMICGLASRINNEWKQDKAGWYILCNGRIIVVADKTELTGWGVYNPQFHSKYRGFIGTAFFFSDDPSKLPWTTSKRGLNRESKVFQVAQKDMISLSKAVISFLNDMYPGEIPEEIAERKAVDNLKRIDISEIINKPTINFQVELNKSTKERTTVTVSYKALKNDLYKIRKHLKQPNSYSASSIGKLTFDHYLNTECVE